MATHKGPSVTTYEFALDAGIKVSKISRLENDLGLAVGGASVRVIAHMPGKSTVGIEVPNAVRQKVLFRDIYGLPVAAAPLAVTLGLNSVGMPITSDIADMPHLLIAGATGSGKSVCLHTLIISILIRMPPKLVRFLMIDPKRLELSAYNGIPNLLTPVINDPLQAASALEWTIQEMERRYKVLQTKGVRSLVKYNALVPEAERLPYIVLVIDEFADLMMTSAESVEKNIVRLAQMARAAGIHLIVATQRPSTDVITGLIKANFPSRIALRTASGYDSRTILDTVGAEKLLGNGDMLFMTSGVAGLTRIQGAYISEAEIDEFADSLKVGAAPQYVSLESVSGGVGVDSSEDEELRGAVEDMVRRFPDCTAYDVQNELYLNLDRAERLLKWAKYWAQYNVEQTGEQSKVA